MSPAAASSLYVPVGTPVAGNPTQEMLEAAFRTAARGRLARLGLATATVLRGRVVVEVRRLHAGPGSGRSVPRKLDPDVLARPLF